MTATQPLQWFSLVLGAWLFASRFVWTHSSAQLTNTGVVAVLFTGIAAAALGIPRAQYVNAILAAWLFVSAWLVPRATDITLWHNVAISIVMGAIVIRSRA
jgi:hypothetical protein